MKIGKKFKVAGGIVCALVLAATVGSLSMGRNSKDNGATAPKLPQQLSEKMSSIPDENKAGQKYLPASIVDGITNSDDIVQAIDEDAMKPGRDLHKAAKGVVAGLKSLEAISGGKFKFSSAVLLSPIGDYEELNYTTNMKVPHTAMNYNITVGRYHAKHGLSDIKITCNVDGDDGFNLSGEYAVLRMAAALATSNNMVPSKPKTGSTVPPAPVGSAKP